MAPLHTDHVKKLTRLRSALCVQVATFSTTENRYFSTAAFYPMAFFRITLVRSAIGLPRRLNGVLAALGLRKRMQTVFHPVSPQVAGQIMKVKELVAVSEVDEALSKSAMKSARKPDPGYYVETPAPG